MRADRLLKVADMLDNLTASELSSFDMNSWSTKDHSCGTTFCAMGFAASKGIINGLWLKREYVGSDNLTITYDGSIGWDAVNKVFDIDSWHSEDLFLGSDQYSTPKAVADKIRNFVSVKGNTNE